jgi:hypothetical protein
VIERQLPTLMDISQPVTENDSGLQQNDRERTLCGQLQTPSALLLRLESAEVAEAAAQPAA